MHPLSEKTNNLGHSLSGMPKWFRAREFGCTKSQCLQNKKWKQIGCTCFVSFSPVLPLPRKSSQKSRVDITINAALKY